MSTVRNTSWISADDAAATYAIIRRTTTVIDHLARWHNRAAAASSGMAPRQAADDALAEIESLFGDLGALRDRITAEAESFDAEREATLADVLEDAGADRGTDE